MKGYVFIIHLIISLTCISSLIIKRSISDNDSNRISARLRISRPNQTTQPVLRPLILIPGDGGSQLEAKLDKPDVTHYFCDKKTTDYFNLWLNLELLVPFVIDCWVDNMRLVYNNESRTTSNSPGVFMRVPDFGNTSGVEFVDPSRVSVASYFHELVSFFVALGYERGVNIRAAPYDFRKAPNEHTEYFQQVKQLIEETHLANNNEKSILLCHSMGCTMMLYFLNHQPQTWKDTYVQSLISLAGPWGGAVKALKAFASGDNFGVIVVQSLTIRQDERTFPSLAYLLPSDKFWDSNETLMQTLTKNYTVDNYNEFFEDINYKTGYDMWSDVKDLTYNLTAPGVEVHCLHGIGVDTMHRVIYSKKFPDSQPNVEYGDGDGTVNDRSLRGCLRWSDQQTQTVYYQNFTKSDHMIIMSDPRILNYIKEHAIYYP